jgi:hypothetical protein
MTAQGPLARWLGPNLLERLLRMEATLRRRRGRAGAVVAVMIALIALADAQVWPGISLAFGYSVPVALGSYVFGLRVGVQLSVLAVVLRRLCAGRTYGPWWLYAGSALMLAEYLMLAIGTGLLGRAVRRLERHARVLRRMSAAARDVTTSVGPETIVRQAVEAAVALTGADGGFAAGAAEEGWITQAVFTSRRWQPCAVELRTDAIAFSGNGLGGARAFGVSILSDDPTLRELGAGAQLAALVPASDARADLALVVFRAEPRPFEHLTSEVLELWALQVAAALTATERHAAALDGTRERPRTVGSPPRRRDAHERA